MILDRRVVILDWIMRRQKNTEIGILKKEANELVSIFVASIKTVKQRLNQKIINGLFILFLHRSRNFYNI